MPMQDILRRHTEQFEDRFIDVCEKALNAGAIEFDEAFPASDTSLVNYRIDPKWKERFEEYEKQARPFRMYRKQWSADPIRQQIRSQRQARTEAEADERFYQAHKLQLTAMAEDKLDFEQTNLPEDMRSYYERAQTEVHGFIPKPKEKPDVDPFAAGFLEG